MYNLPPLFMGRIKKQLPENEWEAFFAVYNHPPVKGMRFNPLKGGMSALKPLLPFAKEPILWEENGFYTDGEKLGASPFHYAGLYYLQEPSAMSAAPLLDVQPGEKVLDLCSAPGGKGTQMACKMQGQGIIVLNEPIFPRAKILSSNVERMGIKNAVVTSEMPETLSKTFVEYFDKILVDAPCSGEGMFRKNADEALGEWSEENVALCAQRQKHILSHATKMLKKGGRLVYSTCTFAYEEDEGQVRDYLQNHPYMRLIKQEKLYPHKVRGEGHFVALFEKEKSTETAKILREKKPSVTAQSKQAWKDFAKKTLVSDFATRLHEGGEVLYHLPEGVFEWNALQVLRAGVRLGEVKNGRFEPSHSLALCSKKEDWKNAVDFAVDDVRVEKYLRGETVETENENGWCLVCVEGYPIGLGKAVNGTLKNHLPKGLRKN